MIDYAKPFSDKKLKIKYVQGGVGFYTYKEYVEADELSYNGWYADIGFLGQLLETLGPCSTKKEAEELARKRIVELHKEEEVPSEQTEKT